MKKNLCILLLIFFVCFGVNYEVSAAPVVSIDDDGDNHPVYNSIGYTTNYDILDMTTSSDTFNLYLDIRFDRPVVFIDPAPNEMLCGFVGFDTDPFNGTGNGILGAGNEVSIDTDLTIDLCMLPMQQYAPPGVSYSINGNILSLTVVHNGADIEDYVVLVGNSPFNESHECMVYGNYDYYNNKIIPGQELTDIAYGRTTGDENPVVPEPSTLVLLGSVLIPAFIKKRNKKA